MFFHRRLRIPADHRGVTSRGQGFCQAGEKAAEGAGSSEQDAHQGALDAAPTAVHRHGQDGCRAREGKTAGGEGHRKGRKEEKVKMPVLAFFHENANLSFFANAFIEH